MKLKTQVTRILLIYGILGVGIVVFGGITDEIFFVLFGMSVTIIGLVMANALQIKHITSMLKKYEMWNDEIDKIITPKSMAEHNQKQNEKNNEAVQP